MKAWVTLRVLLPQKSGIDLDRIQSIANHLILRRGSRRALVSLQGVMRLTASSKSYAGPDSGNTLWFRPSRRQSLSRGP